MNKDQRAEFMKALAEDNSFDELKGREGTEEVPYTKAPEDWKENGVPYGAYCKCDRCGLVERSTLVFDFYAKRAGDKLRCEDCNINEKVRN